MVDEIFTPMFISGPSMAGVRRAWRQRLADNRRQLYQILWHLERQGLILRQGKKLHNPVLSEKGRQRIIKLAVELTEPTRLAPWDGRWHVVIFDIPESHRLGRDMLRDKLYQLGCVQLQRSVFVYPYDIQDIIHRLRAAYDLRWDLNYLVVEKLDRHEELVDLFRTRSILPKA